MILVGVQAANHFGGGVMGGLAGVDLEWVNGHRRSIVQVGLASPSGKGHFVKYVNPGLVWFDPRAVEVHGIDKTTVASAPGFRDVWTEALHWLSDNDIDAMVAHNAAAEATRLSAAIAWSRSPSVPLQIHCTLRWARALRARRSRAWKRLAPDGTSLSLDSLAENLALPTPTHDALADAVTAHALAVRIMDLLGVVDPSEVDSMLGTEPYRVDGGGWLNWQLLEPRCLTIGQLRLAAADHSRALEGRLPSWLIEESWGPQATEYGRPHQNTGYCGLVCIPMTRKISPSSAQCARTNIAC